MSIIPTPVETNRLRHIATSALATSVMLAAVGAQGSSHREAPFITNLPKVDGTDFYMFRSYESDRSGYTTLIANYRPLQAPYGGPNYSTLDEKAVYEIHVDNNADGREDLTFRFDFKTILKGLTVPVGDEAVTVPLKNIGPIGPDARDTDNVNVRQTYTVDVIAGDRRSGTIRSVTNATTGEKTFRKPVDNIGEKSFRGADNYADYAQDHIYDVNIPGCEAEGRVFAGQRQEGFVINLGEVFDLINLNPLGPRDAEVNILGDDNVTSLALEVPTECLTADSDIIGGWTTASKRQSRLLNPVPSTDGQDATVEGGALTQVSRLGSPLVNELVIGLPQKDRFNASEPADDGQFLTFVTNPTLPVLVNSLFSSVAVPDTPRNDLVAAFLTGVEDLNQPANVTPAEMLRLNTAIAPTPPAEQNDLGVLACDLAGFPNGRRPVDDVTDIELTVALGALTAANPNSLQFCDTSGNSPTVQNTGNVVTDGARASGPTASTPFADADTTNAVTYLPEFPYLNTALQGSPYDFLLGSSDEAEENVE